MAWEALELADGVLVPGGFGNRGVEGMILAAQYARENHVPYLGICLGMQVAVIEFARHVCKQPSANSTEFDQATPFPAVVFMPEGSKTHKGGTMRLGLRRTILETVDCNAARLYQVRLPFAKFGMFQMLPICTALSIYLLVPWLGMQISCNRFSLHTFQLSNWFLLLHQLMLHAFCQHESQAIMATACDCRLTNSLTSATGIDTRSTHSTSSSLKQLAWSLWAEMRAEKGWRLLS